MRATRLTIVRTLEEVVRWSVASGAEIVEIVHQDEYTLDVVVHRPDDIFLVYDTT